MNLDDLEPDQFAAFQQQLNDLQPDRLADAYLRGNHKNDLDVIDHCANVVELAGHLGGKDPNATWDFLFQQFRMPESAELISVHKSLAQLIAEFAHRASAVCPTKSAEFWTRAIDTILTGLYGGTSIYIKGKKAVPKELAIRMTPKQIMETFGVSRSYAYKLLQRK